MNLKCKILCALLCLTVLIFAVSSEAAVSVKGKNLDDIEDIISTATDGNANLPKYSLGIMRYMGAKTINDVRIINQAKTQDFSVKKIGDTNDAYTAALTNDYTGGNPYAGMYAAASSLSNRYGRAVMWCDFKFQSDNTTLHVYPYAAFAESTGSSLTLSGTKKLDLTTERNNNDRNDVFEQDIKGGIFLRDDENEYFAAALLNNAQIMLTSGTPYCSAIIFIVGMNLSGDKDVKIFDSGLMIKKDLKKVYSPVSLAVGDFTGSGTTDQIALVTADADAVYATVYKLTKGSDGI